MRYVLGIDQGGSKTYAIIVNETGDVLGFGKSEGTCLIEGKSDQNLDYIEYAVDKALEESRLNLDQIAGSTAKPISAVVLPDSGEDR